jgi:hypothetical protein
MNRRSVHVHYHDQDGLDALLTHAIGPLFQRVGPGYYLRHWLSGPHVRLVFDQDTDVRAAVEEIVGGYLLTHPSRGGLTEEQLLPLHERLAEAEQESGPLTPWRPDNSIHHIVDDTRADDEALLVEQFYRAGNAHALDLVRRITEDGASATGLGFDLMIATGHVLAELGIADTFVSFRSHAEAFLSCDPDGHRLRRAWDAHYAQHGEPLRERVRQLVAGLDGQGVQAAPVREWLALMGPIQDRGRELIAEGRLVLHLPQDHPDDRPEDIVESTFHRALARTRWWPEVRRSPAFGHYRLMINCTYLQMTRIGVRPIDRYLLCHLIANAVEDVYDRSAFAMVGL